MKRICVKSTAWILIVAIVMQVSIPTVALAQLTSLNTQPEIWSYQPVDATDNVNLATGAFNYTVPVTSLPEFPMAIGYSSGVKMNQEAGMFGLGFNGFSGAIGRNVMGIPDDINGADIDFTTSNQKMFDASLTGTLSIPIVDKIMGPVSGITSTAGKAFAKFNVSPSVSLGFGYNNYTGVYGLIGLGLDVGIKGGKALGQSGFGLGSSLGISGSVTSDSRSNGLTYGGGAHIGIQLSHKGGSSLGLSGGTYVGGVDGSRVMQRGSSVGISGGYSGRKGAISTASSIFQSGNNKFSDRNGTSASSLPQLSAITATNKGWGASVSYSVSPALTLTAAFSHYNFGDETATKKVYGFSHLKNYDRSVRDHLADFTIEGEDSFNPSSINNPSYMQRDYYTVNTMGMSGTMQYYQGEYGVVSRNYTRNQFRNIGLVVTTTRKEVYPWHNVTSTHSKKGVDILALLKKKTNPEDKDLDNVLFQEDEVASLNGPDRKFGDATLRMKGDYAGEFNFSEKGPFDTSVNEYRMEHVPNTSDKIAARVFGVENQAPSYSPAFAGNTAKNYAAAAHNSKKLAEHRGTNIKKYTVKDILDSYNAENDDARLAKSFYIHEKIQPGGLGNPAKINAAGAADPTQDFSILQHLKSLRATGDKKYLDDVVGAMEVVSTNGMRYFFNLPVFNKSAKSIGLKGKGINPPQQSGADYSSFDGRDRSKSVTEEKFMYPYAWLLTAIVGDDYVDYDNIPGPSEGDLGYWVKFKYVRTSDNYRWRAPFSGLNHYPGALHTYEDDYYAMQTGEKEVYYLSEIESPDYLVKYQLEQRIDGIDAAAVANGYAQNSTDEVTKSLSYLGSNFLYAVTRINLYKKHDNANNSVQRTAGSEFKLVRATSFEYDYSLCQNVPNNYCTHGGTLPSFISSSYYHAASTGGIKGKLTLRKVQNVFYGDDGSPVKMPSYKFNYGTGSVDNPDYDPEKIDQWGNYLGSAKTTLGTKKFYSNYTEVSQVEADNNARAFSLKSVELPSGGKLTVVYKAKGYGYVENNIPYVMRHMRNLNVVAGENAVTLEVEVSDLEGKSLEEVFKNNKLGESVDDKLIANPRDKEINKIYGEATFYKDARDPNPKHIYIANDQDMRLEFTSTPVFITDPDGRKYQQVKLIGNNAVPFLSVLAKYLYGESDLNQAMKSALSSTPDKAKILRELEEKYENQEKADVLDAVKQIGANVKNVFDGNTEGRFNTLFGEPGGGGLYPSSLIPGMSFIRTPIYKAKYTGAVVDRIEMTDGFSDQLASGNVEGRKIVNKYVTQYNYDENADGTGLSSGVATIEPGGGKSSVIDVLNMTGAGYAPSPSITYAKTAVGGGYADAGVNAPRKKGKTIYEFHTSKLKKLRFNENFRSEEMPKLPSIPNYSVLLTGVMGYIKIKLGFIKMNVPVPIPLVVNYKQSRHYNLKSYSYKDNTDLIGRPLATTVLDDAGNQVNYTKTNYFEDSEEVPVYDHNLTDKSFVKRPGKIDQVWSESYYTKETDNKATIGILRGKTKKNFAYTNMKYSYLPPVVKSIVDKQDVIVKTTENQGFDFHTGNPIIVKTYDSYGNTKITTSEPAYWKYLGMGPNAKGSSYVNKLTEISANTVYLNSIDVNNVLGASFNTWADLNEEKWVLNDYLQPSRAYTGNDFKYVYTPISSDILTMAYTNVSTDKLKIKHTRRLIRPHESYAYRVDLNPNGTFKYFNSFGSPSSDAGKWQLLSENTMYSHTGEVLEVRDVLDNYVSNHLGHNMSYNISSVSNGSYHASVYEGAEDIYEQKGTGKLLLNENRVSMGAAYIVKHAACSPSFMQQTLTSQSFTATPNNVIRITFGRTDLSNTILFSLKVLFKTGQYRILSFYKDEAKILRAVSNRGETFDGFFVVQPLLPHDEIILNPDDFSKPVNVSYSYPQILAQAVYTSMSQSTISCYNPKKYVIPTSTCVPQAHTGSNLFVLEGGESGTVFTFSPKTYGNEINRKFKASVWVHSSSASETQLVISYLAIPGSQAQEKVVKLSEAYAEAGDWRLMRAEFSLTGFESTTTNASALSVFVRNSSPGGISYYDDLRIMPYHATMQNAIYDPAFDRQVANLDGEGFAAWMSYDSYGRLREKSIEVQNVGKRIVQRKAYDFQRPID